MTDYRFLAKVHVRRPHLLKSWWRMHTERVQLRQYTDSHLHISTLIVVDCCN